MEGKRKGRCQSIKNTNISGKAARNRNKISKKIMTKNVSMTFSDVKATKNIEDFLVDNIMETNYECKDEIPPRHSEAGILKDVKQTLSSIN